MKKERTKQLENFVSSEVGTLRKILIHSPDGGIGKIIPTKFEDWLYDDTVHLRTMQKEYDDYIMLLLHFIDPPKAKKVNDYLKKEQNRGKAGIFKPGKSAYFNSDKVIDVQKALSDILEEEIVKIRLVSAICAVESCTQAEQNTLEALKPTELAKTLITGILKGKNKEEIFIFPPVPNLVFTRDIGIMIKDHILLSKSAKQARKRESIIAKYISLFHSNLFANSQNKIIEISEESDFFLKDAKEQKEKIITIEGGDIMMIAPNHLIVGCSERTSKGAADAIINQIFSIPSLEIEKISIVQIPPVRAQMHIDTIFTQIKRNAWVLYGPYSEKLEEKNQFNFTNILKQEEKKNNSERVRVLQFFKDKDRTFDSNGKYFSKELAGIEDLLSSVSIEDFAVHPDDVKIIYSGQGKFPYDEREQWTDSCNLLALKDGVVIGYDRNDKTIEAFGDKENGLGFDVIHAKDLLKKINKEGLDIHDLEDTLILLSSSELSRARGGSHCMSMPLFRDNI